MKKLKLKGKIMLSSALMAGLLVVVGMVTLFLLVDINKKSERVKSEANLSSFLSKKIVDHYDWVAALRQTVYEGKLFDKATDPHKCKFGEWYYSFKPDTPEEKQAYDAIEEPHKRLHESAIDIVEDVKKGDYQGAKYAYAEKTMTALTEVRSALGKMDETIASQVKEAEKAQARSQSRALFFIVGALIVSMGLVVFSWVVSKSIANPIIEIGQVAGKIAEGDLTQKIAAKSDDELGDLARKFNEMGVNLNSIVATIGNTASHLASSSSELSATSEQMAKGSIEQDNQASQVAAAMEEMSTTVMEVARNSAEAADSAKEAAETAKGGGEIVSKTVDRMEKIAKTTQETSRIINALGQSSDKIGEIVAVINDIADQTNLLALNAAIEAARAGEQGRGFAVVADEVRKLAERTTKATKEIAVMIKTIQDDTSGAVTAMAEGGREVEEGVVLAMEAGSSLENIVNKVDRVTEMVQRIAAASEEQSTASEEISSNVENIANVIKQNSSSAQESTAAAHQLANLAQDLTDIVSRFNIGATDNYSSLDEPETSYGGDVINRSEIFEQKRAA